MHPNARIQDAQRHRMPPSPASRMPMPSCTVSSSANHTPPCSTPTPPSAPPLRPPPPPPGLRAASPGETCASWLRWVCSAAGPAAGPRSSAPHPGGAPGVVVGGKSTACMAISLGGLEAAHGEFRCGNLGKAKCGPYYQPAIDKIADKSACVLNVCVDGVVGAV